MWKIYYSDKIVTSEECEPEFAPKMDVQCIVQEDTAHGWQMVVGAEFYVWEDRGEGARWWEAKYDYDLFEYLFLSPGKKVALKGRFIEDSVFDALHAEAMRDPDFRKKTGYRKNERKPLGT